MKLNEYLIALIISKLNNLADKITDSIKIVTVTVSIDVIKHSLFVAVRARAYHTHNIGSS